MTYETKDSGERVQFDSGFQRDVQTGKARYDLVPHEMLTRLAELYARGAEKYNDNNWRKAASQEEFDRFKASAFRHFMQWFRGDEDEDHASAVVFNIFSYEWLTKYKQKEKINFRELFKTKTDPEPVKIDVQVEIDKEKFTKDVKEAQDAYFNAVGKHMVDHAIIGAGPGTIINAKFPEFRINVGDPIYDSEKKLIGHAITANDEDGFAQVRLATDFHFDKIDELTPINYHFWGN